METNNYSRNCIGNVIRIMDTQTILVNVGSPTLSVGDYIQVYEPGPEITDYDGKFLCNYEFIKDKLKVIETNDLYSVCQKQEYTTTSAPTLLSTMLVPSPLFKDIEVPVPLEIDPNDIQPLKISDPLIRIGDPIKHA